MKLLSNAFNLVLSTVIMTGLGFIFWIIVARNYSPYEVGIASTLISTLALIFSFSSLGLGVALIKFLPVKKDKQYLINSTFTLVLLVAMSVSAIFLMLTKSYFTELQFITDNIYYGFIFIFSSMIWVLFTIVDSVFIALQNTKIIVFKSLIFSVFKIVLPFLFLFLGAIGIFISWMVSALIALIFCLIIIGMIFNHRYKSAIHDSAIKEILSFSLGNYVANMLYSLPALILPIIITNLISPVETAYFYIAMMVAGLYFYASQAVSQSYLAHSSKKKFSKKEIKNVLNITFGVLIIGIILLYFFGPPLLKLFGSDYVNSYEVMLLFVLSSLLIAVKHIYTSHLNSQGRVKRVIFMHLVVAVVTISLSFILIQYGLFGISIAWLVGQASIVFFLF